MREEIFNPLRGDRPDAPNVAIILTDGVSNINSRRTIPEAETARKEVSTSMSSTFLFTAVAVTGTRTQIQLFLDCYAEIMSFDSLHD